MIISDNLKMYVQKLRSSNLRPTKQRLKICKFLFDRKKTFHFTVETLNKKINIGSENNKWVLVDDIIFFKEKNQKLNKNIFLRKVL